jgi:hypothetical protein
MAQHLAMTKPSTHVLYFQFLAKSVAKPYFLNHRDQRKRSPTKQSISSTAYTIFYTQTETSQVFMLRNSVL